MQFALSSDKTSGGHKIKTAKRDGRNDILPAHNVVQNYYGVWSNVGNPKTRHHYYPYKLIMDEYAAKVTNKEPTIKELLKALDTQYKALKYPNKRDPTKGRQAHALLKLTSINIVDAFSGINDYFSAFTSYLPNLYQAPDEMHIGDGGGKQRDALKNNFNTFDVSTSAKGGGWSIAPASQSALNANIVSNAAAQNLKNNLDNGEKEAKSALDTL